MSDSRVEKPTRRSIGSVRLSDGRLATVFAPDFDLWICLNGIIYHRPSEEYLPAHDVLKSVVAHCADIEPPTKFLDLCGLVYAIIGTWSKDDRYTSRYYPLIKRSLDWMVWRNSQKSNFLNLMISPPPEIEAAIGRNIIEHKKLPPLPSEILARKRAAALAVKGEEAVETPRSLPPGSNGVAAGSSSDVTARLVVTRKPPRAILDKQEFNLTDEQAAFLDILNRNRDYWIEPRVFDADLILTGTRRDRVKKSLDKRLQAIIKAKTGGGYKLSLAYLA